MRLFEPFDFVNKQMDQMAFYEVNDLLINEEKIGYDVIIGRFLLNQIDKVIEP